MSDEADSPFDHPANALVLEVFRLNGSLIRFGDELVKSLGLTSARWQVLGSIAHGRGTFPVARLADNMGLARQSVQRIVDDLAASGLVSFAPNPTHKRAKLVVMTPQGERVFRQATELWRPVADAMAWDADPRRLSNTAEALAAIRIRLESRSSNRSSE
ncbi:MarR family winged helix-turn-helix transcriptional regulator [Rhodopseudomonas sp. B29]|uniref:MarR family winged helix-turn-helix transcriptional regulator n=1 Tax=Rhodopseudomonas sp. B29 TaxID=95607 RepID=UPI000345E6F2|nr:MarR family transcriptional regulator [Rhodopseudomonas sp. B29]